MQSMQNLKADLESAIMDEYNKKNGICQKTKNSRRRGR